MDRVAGPGNAPSFATTVLWSLDVQPIFAGLRGGKDAVARYGRLSAYQSMLYAYLVCPSAYCNTTFHGVGGGMQEAMPAVRQMEASRATMRQATLMFDLTIHPLITWQLYHGSRHCNCHLIPLRQSRLHYRKVLSGCSGCQKQCRPSCPRGPNLWPRGARDC